MCMGCWRERWTARAQYARGVSGHVGQKDRNAQETAAAEGYRDGSTTEEFNLLPTTIL